MKKLFALLLVLALLLCTLAACNEPGGEGEKVTVRLAGMTGPTSIGMAKLLADDRDSTAANDYEFTVAKAGADIKTKLLQNEVDIAAIPANLAATLYNATEGKVKLLAINTLGVVSILEKGDSIESMADLAGKTVYAPATAQGAIPELVFNYLLAEAEVDPSTVTVEWVEATALASKLAAGGIVLSPQPNATALLKNVAGAREAINLNTAWEALENGADYITGVVVVRTAFLEEHPEAVSAFLTEYAASIEYANQNAAETAALVAEFKILELGLPVITAAIPASNLAFISGESMKSSMKTYIDLLFDASPKAFGGKKPDDGFYFVD